MEVITAFTREAAPVSNHKEILNAISEPVKVEDVNGTGARVAADLPVGKVVIYDIVEYDEETREEFHPDGYTQTAEGYWVQKFTRETHVVRNPRTETYAVLVGSPSERVEEVKIVGDHVQI